jgi:hypothetical protein
MAVDTDSHRSRVALLLVAALWLALGSAACGSDDGSQTDAEAGGAVAEESPSDDPSSEGAETVDEPSDDEPSDDEPSDDEPSDDEVEELFPDVIAATAERSADGAWTFSATLSSPYDSPERYADAWRVVGPSGEVYGIRELTHDHASEQPFTRSQSGIEIPEGVTTVVVEGRDQVSGWGGATFTLDLP